MRLGKKLAVGEVVEHDTVEEPTVAPTTALAEPAVQLVTEPAEQPVAAHAEG